MLNLAGKQLVEAAAKFRAWARENPWRFFLLAAALAAFFWMLIQTIRGGNMGLRTKTFWDWLDLLIVPVVLAVGAWWLNGAEKQAEREAAEKRAQTEREIALDQQHQATLEAYFDRMTELLLEKGLGQTEQNEGEGKPEGERPDSLVVSIAKARTLAVLRTLDSARVGAVLLFLLETKVKEISLAEAIPLADGELNYVVWSGASLVGVNLHGANLYRANLSQSILWEADLSQANLKGANLSRANLWGANLEGVSLNGADLNETNLNRADLSWATLREANLNGASLVSAKLGRADLHGANLVKADLSRTILNQANLSGADLEGVRYDGDTIWPDGFDPEAAGAVLVEDEDNEEE